MNISGHYESSKFGHQIIKSFQIYELIKSDKLKIKMKSKMDQLIMSGLFSVDRGKE